MKKMLLLAIAISVAMAPGCGKDPDEDVARKGVEDRTGSAEKVDITAEPYGTEEEGSQSRVEPREETGRTEPEKAAKKGTDKPIEVGDGNFESEVLKSDIPVIVDFWAPWCGPCRVAAPVLESLAREYSGKIKVCKLNVDNARQTAMKYRIRSIPTLIFYKGGKPVDQMIGVIPNYESELKRRIESYL